MRVGLLTSVAAALTVTRSRGHRPGFVYRTGQSLFLDGNPYRMIGFNVWRAAVSAYNVPPDTGYLVNDSTTLADSLTAINAGGGRMNTIRCWFLQQFALNSAGNTTPSSTYNWTAMDKVVSVAQSAGFKIIAALGDQWDYETDNANIGPSFKDGNWYDTGYTNSFKKYEARPYRQWIQDCVTRYKDSPAIAVWELMNEPAVETNTETAWTNGPNIMRAWVDDCGALIKGIDPDHLLGVGCAGNGNNGTLGTDYQFVNSSPYVDICSHHDYYGAANSTAFETNNGLNTRITQCAAMNKPIYIGEVGIHLNTAPVSGNLTTRASYLNAKMSAQLAMQGMVGYLPWQWDSRGYSDDYNYSVSDPALPVMDAYCL